MCLIAYVPEGSTIPREVFNYAGRINSDGFGVMSAAEGVRKFFGRKALKKARRYSHLLSQDKIAHAVHWRYATHGAPSLELCHPFTTPNGQAHVMHNGVLHEFVQFADFDHSDTELFVQMLDDAPAPAPGESDYWGAVRDMIGRDNKMVVLNGEAFYLLNEDAGIWRDGVWYSNTYSLPSEDIAGDWVTAEMRDDIGDYLLRRFGDSSARGRSLLAGDRGYAIGKRYNMVTGKWDYPEDRKRRRDRCSSFCSDDCVCDGALPSGPTLDALEESEANCMLPVPTGYAED